MIKTDKGTIALDWWRREIHAETGPARALAARLRRTSSPVEVLAEPAVFRLSQGLDLRDPARLTLIAQVLAVVKTHDGVPVARAFGRGESPALSQLRFQRLIRATAPTELSRALRRALPMVDAGCDVARLGQDLYWWNEDVRIRWCFDYFGAAAPAPEQEKANA